MAPALQAGRRTKRLAPTLSSRPIMPWRRRPEFLAQGVPDLGVLARVLVGLAEADHVAGARQLHVVDQLDAAGPAGHHHDAVGEGDGLARDRG